MTAGPDDKTRKPYEPVASGGSRSSAGLQRLRVSDLLAGDREIVLEHGGQDYRLRITAKGKLILTK